MVPIHTLKDINYFMLSIVFYSGYAALSKHILTLYYPLYCPLNNEQESSIQTSTQLVILWGILHKFINVHCPERKKSNK